MIDTMKSKIYFGGFRYHNYQRRGRNARLMACFRKYIGIRRNNKQPIALMVPGSTPLSSVLEYIERDIIYSAIK